MTDKLPGSPEPHEPPVNVPAHAVEPPPVVPYQLTVMPYQPPPARPRRWIVPVVVVAFVLVLCVTGSVAALLIRADQADRTSASASARKEPPTGSVGSPALRRLEAMPADAESNRREYTQSALTSIYFANDSAETVTVNWISYDQERIKYQDLGPGEGYSQQTYAGHVWVITRADGTAVALFEAVEAPGLAEIR